MGGGLSDGVVVVVVCRKTKHSMIFKNRVKNVRLDRR